jgi:hypothetical protein
MRVYESGFEDLARRSIARWGHCEEHNLSHFLSLGTSAKIPVFVSFDDSMGILALKSKTGKLWYVMREVLAPKEKKAEIFLEFAEHIMKDMGIERIQVEFEERFRDELLQKLEDTSLRACSVNYYLDWPLFDMERWDGDKMPGKEWKKLRNIKNKFYKEHKVEVRNPEDADKEELKRIVKDWKSKRNAEDFAYTHEYMDVVENGFKGFDEVRVLFIDSKPRAITGGWKVPNSDQYYSSLGIFDYSVERLGEIANLDDLVYLKSRGYKIVNFGGSDSDLLEFKKKFRPHSQYRTYTFSIAKKNEDEIQNNN